MAKINIDGTIFETDEFPEAAKGTLALMQAAKKKVDEAQVELAMRQGAYNHFGSMLKEQIANVQPVQPMQVVTPVSRKAATKKPASTSRSRKK